MDWSVFLRELHVLGTALGVGGSTFAEIFVIKFAKDKKIDIFENEILKICITVIRIGLIILTFFWLGLHASYFAIMLGFGVFVVLVYFLLEYARKTYLKSK